MKRSPMRRSALALALVLGTAACNHGGSQPTPGPAEVGIVTVESAPATLVTELAGRTSPSLISEVRPQISGIVLRRLFEEGAYVSKGQLLYQINPAPYQAAFDKARASLARAEATLVSVNSRASRTKDLVGIDAVSRQDADDAASARGQAVADVESARAAVRSAKIDLEFTRITAPISGRIGRSLITAGALVTTGQAAPLATIQTLDPIFVDVPQSSAELLRLKNAFAKGEARNAEAPVSLTLPDGSPYPIKGSLRFSEVSVDPSSGAVILRAVFPNPTGTLLPGMYVKAKLVDGVEDHAILVPQQGVTRDERGRATALVVGKGDKVEQRHIETVRAVGDRWLIASGLQPGDRLIVDGVQRATPGATVKPVRASLSKTASAR
ncbi:efflux RND transporter periplasmic adaptor subunit [Sphingobium sp. H39-3-25]|jgi:membrane fusion protein (multidrug efflux system)|uniref:efflux RND transporter periplasmic adaptor subunit n=1 Tax=Sphingomonadales TaxID=204457 RepID=UPI000829CC0C|nr:MULTISPECIES: efflux RND transporter periplasmic adaptor subunit [Sphingomonadaceae]MDF0488871.1 efflux RND transporter periplasmic adaptor subunit [Sphingomonas pollutisoli]MDF0546078.1 efflux RND transporter periplasmic adaptor subunit [Sphingobium arseniciresistens]